MSCCLVQSADLPGGVVGVKVGGVSSNTAEEDTYIGTGQRSAAGEYMLEASLWREGAHGHTLSVARKTGEGRRPLGICLKLKVLEWLTHELFICVERLCTIT